jgi:hypothetical protein
MEEHKSKIPKFTFKAVSTLLNQINKNTKLAADQKKMFGNVIRDAAARERTAYLGKNIDKKA